MNSDELVLEKFFLFLKLETHISLKLEYKILHFHSPKSCIGSTKNLKYPEFRAGFRAIAVVKLKIN